MTADKLHEQGFNYALAAALRACDPAWRKSTGGKDVIRAERTGQEGRVDILIDDPTMPKVAVECAFEGDAGQDAAARLDDKDMDIDTAISVSAPVKFKSLSEVSAVQALGRGAEIGYAVLQKDYRFPKDGYLQGSVRDLAGFIRVASVSKDKVEEVGEKVVELIRGAGGSLSAGLPEWTHDEIAELMSQRTILSGMHTTAVLWLDALLVQHMIAQVNKNIKPPPARNAAVVPSDLVTEWRKILQVNWRSIFAPAVAALELAAQYNASAVSRALENLLAAVETLHIARLGQRIHVGAELFPRISDDRKQAAAFYTLPSTAELLTALTIGEHDGHAWRDENLFRTLKIADFACGTGTLLRAALHRIAHFHSVTGGDEQSLQTLRRGALESGLVGADISPIAAHLTVSSLALAIAGQPYSRSGVGNIQVGGPDKTGALEFLAHRIVQNDLVSGSSQAVLSGQDDAADNFIAAADASFDYVIMNPPYSLSRGGQRAFDVAGLTAKERGACQKRWGKLINGLSASKKAGKAASFLCLAHQKLKPGGRIGFVLPLTAAFAYSWEATRAMLVTKFTDIVAITSAARGAQSHISADTHMGEMLLVATKLENENTAPAPVLCVIPQRMPMKIGEAGEYARGILRVITDMPEAKGYIQAGRSELGRVIRFMPARATAPWSCVGAQNIDLSAAAHLLAAGVMENFSTQKHTPMECAMAPIQDLFEIGPVNPLIGRPVGGEKIGAFTFYPVTDAGDAVGPDRALYKNDAKMQTKLQILPTHKGVSINRKALQSIADRRGYLHYALELRWTSQKLVAASTPHPVFGGSAWITLLHDNDELRRAFALWANSTFGAIVHWTHGGRVLPGKARTSSRVIAQIPAPDLRQLPAAKLKTAAKFFDSVKDRELLPVCQLHCDPVRHEIDRAVAAMLGLPYDENAMQELRRAWCGEPSVHGNNKTALAALARPDKN